MKAVAQLTCAVLITAALFGRAAHADACACANDSAPPNAQLSSSAPSSAASPSSDVAAQHDIKKPAARVKKPVSKSGANNFDLRLVGSDANSETNPDTLKAGEISHKYVGIELGGNLDSLVKTKVQVRFTEAQSDPGKAMFDLQPGNQSGDAHRALRDFSAASSFLDERVTLSSYARSSSFAVTDAAGGDTKGQLEQHHVAATLWRSDRADLDVDAGLSKTSSNYWDFGDSPDSDLHANNNRISQYRSKLRLDRVGLSLSHRDASTLVVANAGDVGPSRSESEAKISLDVADLRDGIGVGGGYRQLLPLPDSIWVGANHGAYTADDLSLMLHETVNKVSLGASRNFSHGTINVSYWQSATQPTRDSLAGYRGTGHGLDLGSNLNFGALGLTGSVGLVDQQNFSAGTESDLSTLNCAVFLTWQTPLGVDLKAGMTRNSVQNEFADFGRLEENNAFRYQLALDLSHLASQSWPQSNVQLKVLASFQGNQNHLQMDLADGAGNMFTGVQLAIPLHP